MDGREVTVYTDLEILQAIEAYREFVVSQDCKWKLEEGLAALHINPSWLVEPYFFAIIRQFLFYKHSPHSCYPGDFGEQPQVWVDSCIVLDAIFGSSL